MRKNTHLSTSVVETHKSEDGTLVTARARLRTEEETARLRRLAATLSPVRPFSVTRGIVVAHPTRRNGPTSVELRSLSVHAATGAEAAGLANAIKEATDVEVRN